jgi:hypothetical protein
MPLTGDGHAHSEWSWDTGGPGSDAADRMQAMCRRALKIWAACAGLHRARLPHRLGHRAGGPTRSSSSDGGLLTLDPLDVGGYLDSIERCRWQFPGYAFSAESSSVSHTSTRLGHGRSSTSPHDALACHSYEAMAMAEHFGFRQGRRPEDFWTR